MPAWDFLLLHLKLFGLVALGCGVLELSGRLLVRAVKSAVQRKSAAQRSQERRVPVEDKRREVKPRTTVLTPAACLYHHQPVRNLH